MRIPRAVQLFGRKFIESAVLCYDMRGKLAHSSLADRVLWEHAVACAVIAADIMRLTGSKNVETAYVCGLLHDVGKTVMRLRFPDAMQAILEDLYNRCQDEDFPISSVAMENESLDIDTGVSAPSAFMCGSVKKKPSWPVPTIIAPSTPKEGPSDPLRSALRIFCATK